MTGKILTGLIAGALVLVVIGAVAVSNINNQFTTLNNQLETLRLRKESTVNTDSVQSAIERKVFDSLKIELQKQDFEIQELRKDVHKTRKQNEELTRRFNSVNVSMPEF